MRPEDAQYNHGGTYYKLGRFGYLFRWINGWVRANVTENTMRSIRCNRI